MIPGQTVPYFVPGAWLGSTQEERFVIEVATVHPRAPISCSPFHGWGQLGPL